MICAALQARLETVPQIGVVTGWEPLANTRAEFETYFKAPTLAYVLGWSITRESTAVGPYTMGKNLQLHQLVIRGYRALDNAAATEREFQDLIEAVTAALRLEETGKFNAGAIQVAPPQVRLVEPRLFGFGDGAALMHYAELGLEVAEAVTFG